MKKIIALFIAFLLFANITKAQNLDNSLIPYRLGDLWGFANANKNIIITPKYQEVSFFQKGLAAVKLNGKYGYINLTGKVVIPFVYAVANSFMVGYIENTKLNKVDTIIFAGASLKKDGEEICINKYGKVLSKCPAFEENNMGQVDKLVVKEKVYSETSLNTSLYDKIVDDYTLSSSSDLYYLVKKNNLYGIINNKFEIIIPLKYTSLSLVDYNSNKYLKYSENGSTFGLMSTDGKNLLNPDENLLEIINLPENKTLLLTNIGDTAKAYNSNFKNILNGLYTKISYDKNGGLRLENASNLKGYYFLNTGILLPNQYTNIETLVDKLVVKITLPNGKVGYINNDGAAFFEN